MMTALRYLAVIAILATLVGCTAESNEPGTTTTPEVKKGDPIVIELEMYPKKAPKTVERIASLIESGFYKDMRIHRVIPGAVQWGSPLSRTLDLRDQQVGSGGSGKPNLPYEDTDIKMEPGALCMASTGAKVGGDSQMFIVTASGPPGQAEAWQGSYAAFGKVTKNMEAVEKIQVGDTLQMKVIEKTPDVVKVELTIVPYM